MQRAGMNWPLIKDLENLGKKQYYKVEKRQAGGCSPLEKLALQCRSNEDCFTILFDQEVH